MMEENLEVSFKAAKPYKGKSLKGWLFKWFAMPESELAKINSGFLTIMTAWVVEKFKKRGVPVGHLDKFVDHRANERKIADRTTLADLMEAKSPPKFNFADALMAMAMSILRKRGLKEADELTKSPLFVDFDKAFQRDRKGS